MSELRYCPIKNRWAIIAPERRLRPLEFLVPEQGGMPPSPEIDPFAPGNEDQTTPEIFSLPPIDNDSAARWQVRVFANKFPALRVEGEVIREGVGLNDSVSGVGAHEVIVECPESAREMADFSVSELLRVLQAWRATDHRSSTGHSAALCPDLQEPGIRGRSFGDPLPLPAHRHTDHPLRGGPGTEIGPRTLQAQGTLPLLRSRPSGARTRRPGRHRDRRLCRSQSLCLGASVRNLDSAEAPRSRFRDSPMTPNSGGWR